MIASFHIDTCFEELADALVAILAFVSALAPFSDSTVGFVGVSAAAAVVVAVALHDSFQIFAFQVGYLIYSGILLRLMLMQKTIWTQVLVMKM